jgi:hypothetical protein
MAFSRSVLQPLGVDANAEAERAVIPTVKEASQVIAFINSYNGTDSKIVQYNWRILDKRVKGVHERIAIIDCSDEESA